MNFLKFRIEFVMYLYFIVDLLLLAQTKNRQSR